MKNTGIVIASLVGGMIVGSALTLLLTPQSGAELRKRIQDAVDNGADKLEDKLAKLHDKIEETACKCNG